MAIIDRTDPPIEAPERAMLEAFLDFLRATILLKADGLSDEDLRRPMVPSGTSLLGMIKHLAFVERWWFQSVFAGADVDFPWTDDDPDADWRPEPEETADQILDLYRSECEASRRVIAQASPDDHEAGESSRGKTTLRWILIHMIEETARHAGHADILREMIDGATGE
jgi:uncharacterized damage-inducible protein DinB